MGSYSSTAIDGFELWSSKYSIDEDSLSIFLERDRRSPRDPDVDPDDYDDDTDASLWHRHEYAVSADHMRERLDALGFTEGRARDDYRRGHEYECELQEEWADDGNMSVTHEDVARLKRLTFEDWQAAFAAGVRRGNKLWKAEDWLSSEQGKLLGPDEDGGIARFFSDRRLFMRAALGALSDASEVVLDFTDLIHSGEYEPDQTLCDDARDDWAATHPVYGRIVVLTEGRSDSRILSAALTKLSPHLADLFGFLDFDGLRIEGSTGALARTIRAFVGAKMSSRVIAIFDNDTAGAEAIDSLRTVSLPPNFRIMSLPRSEVAGSYPTAGPQGIVDMDVNGLAASIELYLGAEALRGASGQLRQVRWTGWHDKLQRYQGAVEQKSEIQQRFIELLASTKDPADARQAFPDLARVVDTIAFAFAK